MNVVFIRDEGSVYDVPVHQVWEFLGAPEVHQAAHRHRNVRRVTVGESAGEYSWEQDWDGQPTRFTMRWTAFAPLAIAYEVLDGPFRGSRFFLYYTPQGNRTAVAIVGEFVSPTIPSAKVRAAVERFFRLEFDQDLDAIRKLANPPEHL